MRRRHFLQGSITAAAAAATGLGLGPLDPFRALDGPGAVAGGVPRPVDAPLRLNSNENPLGPSESARRAILGGMAEVNRYTHALAAPLRARLAAHHGVAEESIVLGNGSTEVLRMAVQAMAGPAGWGPRPGAGRRARLVVADPTFEHIEDYAVPWGLELVKVPLTAGHAHDIGRMREAVASARVAGSGGSGGSSGAGAGLGAGADGGARPVLVYICNPNNPTGSLTPSADVDAWIREAPGDVVFLVDEAYLEYVDDASYRSALPLALAQPNVVVVRTFSKVHGLAGLRLGYGIARPETARRIAAYSGRSNLNAFALLAADASLDDDAHVRRSLVVNAEARRLTHELLDELDLARIPTHANFIMHRVPGEQRDYIRRMREAGVWVGRTFPPMTGHNRLSFGTVEEMGRFGEVLRGFRARGWV